MIEGLPEKNKRWEDIKEHKWSILGGVVLFLVIVFFIMLISGSQDCEITSLQEGVIQTCDCRGMVVTVRSTTNSREKRTVCLGRIANTIVHKEVER
jgi:hypothetical protein